jgi:two-component system, OmpR family, copper resistance phosphate regulon response regulator CusR
MKIVNVSSEIKMNHTSLNKKFRVLVVEDEVLVGWSLVKSLSKNNLDVTVVDSGEKAFELITSNEFDLVITDVNLPIIDGGEVASFVKKRNPHIPVIMMSALTENSPQGSGFSSNIDHFIEKPFDIVEIISVINELLPKPGSQFKSNGLC